MGTRWLLLALVALTTGCGSSDAANAPPAANDTPGASADGGGDPRANDAGAVEGGTEASAPEGGAADASAGDGAVATFAPKMTMLMGANGAPGDANGLALWKPMGLRFSRVEVGPVDSTDAQDLQNKGYFSKSSDADILFNGANGISTMVLLAYSAPWNGLRAGDDKSAPKDVSVWTNFVDAVVKYYSAPPFNVKYFQIWNEAAGTLSGGSPQATFWHGPGDLNQPYATAMEDYVNTVHIPAAKVIRSYNARVVYGGWPDQGGLDTYVQWLEYKSPSFNGQTMLDWTDYLDLHYLGSNDMESIYSRYAGTGKIRGIWQTEVGFDYMVDQNYISDLYFNIAIMALKNGWSDPDQFVAQVYHWWGGQGFMLTGADGIHDSGRSLETLTAVVNGKLSTFPNDIQLSAKAHANALYNDAQIVFQIIAPQGPATVDVDNLPAPAGFSVAYKEVVLGTDLASSITSSSWTGNHLSVKLDVPAGRNDANGTYHDLMGFLVVTPTN